MSPIPRALRQHVTERAKHRCGYCQTQEWLIGMPLEIEHIIPEVLGGNSTESNLWLTCPSCNRHKSQSISATYPETGQRAPLFNPHNQLWNDHFQLYDSGLYNWPYANGTRYSKNAPHE